MPFLLQVINTLGLVAVGFLTFGLVGSILGNSPIARVIKILLTLIVPFLWMYLVDRANYGNSVIIYLALLFLPYICLLYIYAVADKNEAEEEKDQGKDI